MNDLIKTEFFVLINKDSQEVMNEQMFNAYGYFTEKIENLNQSDKDYQTVYRILNLTRIEFQSLQTHILYEQGEKCA